MYLMLLDENEKKLFLGLAYNLAIADGDYSDAEKATILAYCHEMYMEFDESIKTKSVEMIINGFENSSDQVKKIVIFELIGLAMADGKYDYTEREIVEKTRCAFGIDKSYADNCEKILNEYIVFQDKINNFVVG